ncbi:ABC transporter substrate-binding protein [Ruegeria faecimaris]|uniref:Iron(III) transport system substrate-binding protein n=1 Tax=Ruegeria faecimaris TaxID=686389 RepID=A0A521DLL0_9RHOB|nr:extracellular solute-binding protein [Ruegeria faecimaris]SMO71830.1 iron(III) transport system substrate-binding protein [Ruegeria faecimaris]
MIRALALVALSLIPSLSRAQEAIAEFGAGQDPMLIRSTTDIAIIAPVLERFTALNPNLQVTYEQWGSNALFQHSRTVCKSGENPADIVFSSAIQQMVWLVNSACGHRFQSDLTNALPAARRWRDELWGITTEPAVIVYNKTLLQDQNVPRSRFALLDMMRTQPDLLRGRVATYDIAASGLGYLFAYGDSLEATTFGSLIEGFARIDAVATCCSAEIIRDVANGRFLIAYNVLGSYVANAKAPGIGVILPEDYTLVLSRALMIPRQARNKQAATEFLDFLLSPQAQTLLATSGLVAQMDTADTGLTPSARRFIALSPALLVARDQNRRAELFKLWNDAFDVESAR